MYFYRNAIKPALDRVMAMILIVVLSPLILCIAALLSIQNKGTPFFAHERVGKDERIFRVFKFKTMRDSQDRDGNLLPDKERLTPLGALVRKTSLDELPQLFNIIRGEMSLVGPRPLVPEYLPYYSAYHSRRHEVTPGVTGLAQICGRNRLPFSKRFNADVEYVDNISLLLDAKILVMTIVAIFRSDDITLGNDLRQIDDVGVTRALPKHYFHSR